MGLSAAFALSVNAQTTIKIKNPLKKATKENATAKTASPMQVAATIVCNTQYVAGSTMDLNFTYTASNTDLEFVDLLTITFPAGITPNSSPNATFPTSNTGGGAENLNAPAGQVISWGVDNNDGYGGIISTASGVNFTVNCTITAGTTGNQTATFDASGDGYGASPGDLVGATFIIYPAGATVVNMQTKIVAVVTNTVTFATAAANNCLMGTHLVAAQIHNLGTNAESNIPVNYSVNGVASIATTYTGSIAPGDSGVVVFPMPYDFSAQGMYNVKSWTAMAGDVAMGNDTAAMILSNSIPVALTSANYTNGVETAYEVGSVNLDWVGTGTSFGLSQANFHSGAQAYFLTLPGSGVPVGTYESFVNFPCTDITAGDVYKISYWRKSSASGTLTVNGQTGIFTGLGQDAASMTTVVKAYSAMTPTTATGTAGWVKDSVNYIATATETRYFAVAGKGTIAGAADQISIRLDDFLITKIGTTVGVKTNTADLISIFPNPSTGLLNVNTVDATSSLEVYNVIGEKVYANANLIKGNNNIDLSGLSNGSYFVRINSNNQITTKKVVINK